MSVSQGATSGNDDTAFSSAFSAEMFKNTYAETRFFDASRSVFVHFWCKAYDSACYLCYFEAIAERFFSPPLGVILNDC